jgi:CRP-like cAMP-binding protein
MKDLKIFNRLPDHIHEEISSFAKLSVYEAGQVIHAQGLSPQDFYIIYEGKAEVILDNGSGEKVSFRTHLNVDWRGVDDAEQHPHCQNQPPLQPTVSQGAGRRKIVVVI